MLVYKAVQIGSCHGLRLRERHSYEGGEIVDRAGRLLADAAPPKSKVILFGSHGRGDPDANSDFDFLVLGRSINVPFLS
jgi:predicted nucleotidyltransferase